MARNPNPYRNIYKAGGSPVISIPKDVMIDCDLKIGDVVLVRAVRGTIVMERVDNNRDG